MTTLDASPTGVPEHLRVTPIEISPSTMVEWTRPEPVSALEQRCMDGLEPGDYEIYDEKLLNILDETREIFIRSGVSAMLRAGDLIVGLYTANGDLANASAGTYLHCVTAMLPVKFVVHKYLPDPSVGVRDGDIFYVNEARYGGIHNPDQMAFMPIFNDGELIAWAAALAHQPETGAVEPGGMPRSARTRHDEGMKLTPIKIGEDFTIRQDMLDMMENFVSRAPRMQAIDVRARVTGCDRLRKRVVELAKDRGNDFVRGLLRKLVVEAEQATRKRISRWNDGIYRSTVFIDTMGHTHCLLRASFTAIKRGEEITFDLTGTSPDNDGPYNCFPHIVAAHSAIILYAYAFNDLPVSNGALACFNWKVPSGTIFDAHPEAAISSSPLLNGLTVSATNQLIARMMYDSDDYDKVAADISAQGSTPIIAGKNQHGIPVADLDTACMNTHGHGARPDLDGVDAYGFPWAHAGRAPDTEDAETELQFLRLYWNLRIDACGHGTRRGGAGSETALVIRHVPEALWTVNSRNSFFPTGLGLFGAYPAAASPGISIKDTDIWEKAERGDDDLPSTTLELAQERAIDGTYVFEHSSRAVRPGKNGDVIVQLTGGGGGYGDPLVREPEQVAEDVRVKIISRWTAENIYQVRFFEDSLQVDVEATEEARNGARRDRLARGKPYEDFLDEWSQRRPAEAALAYFGSWPEGKRETPLRRI